MVFPGDSAWLLIRDGKRDIDGLIALNIFCMALGAGLALLYVITSRIGEVVFRRQRRAAMRRSYEILKALKDYGFTLKDCASQAEAALLAPFEIGQRGDPSSRGVLDLNESTAANGATIRMMDYIYWAKKSTNHPVPLQQTVVLIEHPGLALPQFRITKEFMARWAQKLWRVKDIDFSEHPKFSEMFKVRGEDETAVRAVLSPQIRSGLEQHPGLTIEGFVTQIVIFRDDVSLPPDQWPGFLAEAAEVAKLFIDSAAGST